MAWIIPSGWLEARSKGNEISPESDSCTKAMCQEKTSDGKSVITNLFSVPVAGGVTRQLTSGLDKDKAKRVCKWSPAGKLIAYISAPTGSIKVIPVEGGELGLWLMEDFLPLVKKGTR